LETALPHLGLTSTRYSHLDLANFFSPKDIEYAIGWPPWRKAILTGKVHQSNSLTGRVGVIRLRDLKGWAGKEKLVDFAAALGIPMPAKTSMDDYKSNMRRGLEEHPEDFLYYAVEDARVLLTLYQKFVTFMREIQRETLGMTEGWWRASDIPLTLGRLVAGTFERWLVNRAGPHESVLAFCLRKLGYLDPGAADYDQARLVRADLLGRVRGMEDLKALASDPADRSLLKAFLRARYLFTGLDGCGVRWWVSRATTETAGLNALIHGGRCHNERPDEYRTGPGLDVDIVGCYGTTLRTLVYPVGLPSVWSYEPNEKRPTLGEWLDRHEADLVDGLWTITVSGPLPFEQDLLYSKLVKGQGVRRAADPDEGDVRADLVLLRRPLQNTVLTADLLAALRAIATNTEWAALRCVEVVTACAYLKGDQKANLTDWCQTILASPVAQYQARLDAGTPQDRRPHDWFAVPLEGFVGPLVNARQHLKKQLRETADPDEQHHLEGLGTVLKLIVNTLYGVQASRHFPIGNTIVANNITGRARLGVWMLAKALGLRQSITDGGIYTPSAVPHWKGRRPGLETLSRMADWSTRWHGRTLRPLAGLEQWDGTTPIPANADAIALAHVQRFWSPYGLVFPFTLEHKHAFTAAAYWSKGDQSLRRADGTTRDCLRGKDKRARDKYGEDKKEKIHPTFTLLDTILAEGDDFPTDLAYRRKGLLKVAGYRLAQASPSGYAAYKNLRPGDDLPGTVYQARYNNLHCPLANLADYLHRSRRRPIHLGHPVEFFERYRTRGIAAVHRAMLADRLR
jgi:hypothetical protein